MYAWRAKAWMILVYAQDDLNLHILCMFKYTISLDTSQIRVDGASRKHEASWWPGGKRSHIWITRSGLESYWSRIQLIIVWGFTAQSFIITLPPSGYDLNDVERDVKHQTFIIMYLHFQF